MEEPTSSFQELWRTAVGMSSIQDPKLVKVDLIKSMDIFKQGLDFFKQYSDASAKELKQSKKMSENLQKFVMRAAKLLNVDCCQMHKIIRQFSQTHFRGSKEKLHQMLTNDKNSFQLLSSIAEYYFTERLYCLKCFSPMISHFQDKEHPFQDVYVELLENLQDLVPTLLKQFESLFSSKGLTPSKRGSECTAEVASQLAIQQIKEQCEILQLLVLFFSHFEIPCEVIVKLAKIFKDYSFGMNHPLCEIVDTGVFDPLLSCMSNLMQVVLIEGFDFGLLQEADAASLHPLSKDKQSFKIVDDVIVSVMDEASLSPLILAWAGVRYVLLGDSDATVTQKLGERAIDVNVWREMMRVVSAPPFDTDTKVALTAKNALRGVISCVTKSFHEDTLGVYGDLVAMTTLLLGQEPLETGRGLAGYDLDPLLLSTVGYFPLNICPMLQLLSGMATTENASVQIHAFLSNLPTFAEYLTTCARDEVESFQDGSCWKLLCDKPIFVAGGQHTIKLPVGTVGQLIDSQQGAMVQWQYTSSGWKVFLAEIKSMLKYKGPSSNYQLLGFIDKVQLIYGLIEKILTSLQSSSSAETNCMAVLESMDLFIARIPALIQKIVQMTEPATELVATCLRCYRAVVKLNPNENAEKILRELSQLRFFPATDNGTFGVTSDGGQMQPGIFGSLVMEWERKEGTYLVTMATVDLLTAFLEYYMDCSDGSAIHHLSPTVVFVSNEIFCALLKWQRNDNLWDKIGVRCLRLFHIILRTSTDQQSAQELQQLVVNLLLDRNGAEVLLKIAAIHVDAVQALYITQPLSSSADEMTEVVRFAFSVLNNLLRLSVDHVGDSYLHQVLAMPNAGDTNLISNVAGYIYHHHTSSLPLLSLAILRQVALVAPMSLHANLGPDVVAFRDILLWRLRSRTELHSFKIAALDLLVVSVQTQPGLLELFLDIESVDKNKPELGAKVGKCSFFRVILEMLEPKKQGTYQLPTALHASCLKFINALWVDRRHSVLQTLKSSGEAFWKSLLLPLFSENSPKEIAQNELLEASAHSMNVLALEHFYTEKNKLDSVLKDLMKKFKEKKRVQHWSKVFLCVAKSLLAAEKSERERQLMFTSAWQTFVSCAKLDDKVVLDGIIDDMLSAISFLAGDLATCKEARTFLILATDLLLTQIHCLIKKKVSMPKADQWFISVIRAIQTLSESGEFPKPTYYLHNTAMHLAKEIKKPDQNGVADLTACTCHHLSLLLTIQEQSLSPFATEACIVLIQTLEQLHEDEVVDLSQSWINCVTQESTIYLLMSVLVKLTAVCKEETERYSALCIAILRLFIRVAEGHTIALMIQRTKNLAQLCLNLTNTYNSKSKKWLNLYHLSLHFMSRMIACLSHDFLEETLDFIGVHQERMLQSLAAMTLNQSESLVREVDYSTALLAATSTKFVASWKFKMSKLFRFTLQQIAVTCQTSIALLLHPRLLHETLKMREKKQTKQLLSGTPSVSSQVTAKALSFRNKDDDSGSRKVTKLQRHLVSILANCLDFLKNLSPNISQIMLDEGLAADEYPSLLGINFSTPSMERNEPITFGGVIGAANFALSSLNKIDASDSAQSTYRDSMTYVADTALVLVMSQCLLLLKQSGVSNRNKQLLRRELGDELSACVRSATRHLRHSSSSYSPQSSPSTSQPVQTGLSKSDGKGILDLVNKYIKHVLR